MDLVIGLDSGTTATKAVAVAADATVIATSSVGYPLLVPEPGYAELDPVRLQQAAVEAVAEVVTQVRQRGDRVVGLCLSAAMHGLVPLDDAGSPTGPLITWADSRAAEESRSLALELAGGVAQAHRYAGPSHVPTAQAAVVAAASPRRLRQHPQVGRCQGSGAVRIVRGRVPDRLVMCLHHRVCTTSRPVSGIQRRCSSLVLMLSSWLPSCPPLMW